MTLEGFLSARVRTSLAIVALAVVLPSCSLFLRPGSVEERPEGRTLTFPAQTGQYEATGWTKTFEPSLVRRKDKDVVDVMIVLSAHVSSPGGYAPTSCGQIVVKSTDAELGGVAAEARQEFAGGREIFTASFSVSDLKPYATDDGGRIVLCDYTYRFGGRGLASLLR